MPRISCVYRVKLNVRIHRRLTYPDPCDGSITQTDRLDTVRGASDRLSDTQKITEEMQSSEETETLSLHIAPVLGPCLVPVHARTSHTPRQSDYVRPTAETPRCEEKLREEQDQVKTHTHTPTRGHV